MSPPEVWGPAIWTLFHTLAEKINPDTYSIVVHSMFSMIVKICKYLPCPDCSTHASNFLAKVDINRHKTKEEFKTLFYVFHNSVNARNKKKLFLYSDLKIYANYNLVNVVKNFISKYNTNGNMKLLTETFQRKFVISAFLKWFHFHHTAFVQPKIQEINTITNNNINTDVNTDTNTDVNTNTETETK